MSECWLCRKECSKKTTLCNCIGDMSLIHDNCLIEWIIESKSCKCKFCKTEYKFSNLNLFIFYYLVFCKRLGQFWNFLDEIGQIMIDNHIIF